MGETIGRKAAAGARGGGRRSFGAAVLAALLVWGIGSDDAQAQVDDIDRARRMHDRLAGVIGEGAWAG